MKKEFRNQKIYLKSWGWPLVTVARDGAGCIKEGKWFGVNGLEQECERKFI